MYLYIACTSYWKTNFNSQDWLIESFFNKISLNYFFQEGTVQYDWFWCGPDFPISAQGHGNWQLYSQIQLVLWMRESCVLVQFQQHGQLMSTAKEKEKENLFTPGLSPGCTQTSGTVFSYIYNDLLVGKYSQTLPYRHLIIMDSLRCPWGKEALTFSLNSTHLIHWDNS